MKIDRVLAEKAIQPIATALGKSIHETAEGMINTVNENMLVRYV